MKELPIEQIAWLAGIYEGEGTCTLGKNGALNVTISMTDQDIIERIHVFTKIGSITRKDPKVLTHKPVFIWNVSSYPAICFLEAILPWLGQRRK